MSVFCKHQFVDCPPENKLVHENNRKKEIENETLREKLDDFKAGRSKTPPLNVLGRAIRDRLPTIAREHLLIQCHCHQMRCAMENSNVGSTCELSCCDPKTKAKMLR